MLRNEHAANLALTDAIKPAKPANPAVIGSTFHEPAPVRQHKQAGFLQSLVRRIAAKG